MSQELSLVLAQPVEQLVPLLIKWNNEELMREVELRLARFEGVTYTAEQVGEAKKEKAALNAFIKALNDERIRIGKVYATPMDKFKGEVDEVISRVKSVVEGIDVQLRAYEETRSAEKQEKILEYFKGVIGDFSGLIPYERIHNPKWLNASVRDAAVFAEIDKMEKTKLSVQQFSRREEAYMPWALLAMLLLAIEIGLRYTLLRNIP